MFGKTIASAITVTDQNKDEHYKEPIIRRIRKRGKTRVATTQLVVALHLIGLLRGQRQFSGPIKGCEKAKPMKSSRRLIINCVNSC